VPSNETGFGTVMTTILWILGLALVIVLLYFLTRKGWISWKGGRGIASLTAFHDFQPEDRQKAIEFVMDRKAGKRIEADESGEGNDEPESPSPGGDKETHPH
jgi:hypothetical protein